MRKKERGEWRRAKLEQLFLLSPSCRNPLCQKNTRLNAKETNHDRATLDHIVSLSNGGARKCLANITLLCKQCNKKKGNNDSLIPNLVSELDKISPETKMLLRRQQKEMRAKFETIGENYA